jgi:FMN phosphatase YigB (HAD superfamily)
VLLVDFGGVLVRTTDESGLASWRQRLGLGSRTMAGALFDNEVSSRAMIGTIAGDALFAALAGHFSISERDTADLWEAFWQSQSRDEDLITYLESIGDRVELAICSNFWPNYAEVMHERYGLHRSIARTFVSAQLGSAKPTERFFGAVKELCGPGRSLALVDDIHWNVDGAKKASIHGIHHTRTADTIAQIEHWLAAG